jgi:hypothetical protein
MQISGDVKNKFAALQREREINLVMILLMLCVLLCKETVGVVSLDGQRERRWPKLISSLLIASDAAVGFFAINSRSKREEKTYETF